MPTPTDDLADLPVIAWEFNEGIALEFAEDVTDEMREGEPYRALTYQDTALATIERLQAENQALRADAERYRWLLRENPGAVAATAWRVQSACAHAEPEAALTQAMKDHP